MTEAILKQRFRKFALDIVKLCSKFPKETVYFSISKQIIDSASSSAANYNAACRAKSILDFINKLKIVEEELDESLFWLDFTRGVDIKWDPEVKPIENEGNELLSIIVASIKTSRNKLASYGTKKRQPAPRSK